MSASPDGGTILTWLVKGVGGLTTIVDGLDSVRVSMSQGQADQLSHAAAELSAAVERFILNSME